MTANTHSGSARVTELELVDHADADVLEFRHLIEHAKSLLQRNRLGDQLLRLQLSALDHAQQRGIAERLNRQRAGYLNLLEHDLIDRQRDFALLALRGEADLDMTPSLAEAQHCVATGGGDSQRVHADIGAAVRQVHDRLYRVSLLSIDYIGGADLVCQFELAIVQIDGDHPHAQSRANLDRRQA